MALGQSCWRGPGWGHLGWPCTMALALFSCTEEAGATAAQPGIAAFALVHAHTLSWGLTQALNPGSRQGCSSCSCPPQVLLH